MPENKVTLSDLREDSEEALAVMLREANENHDQINAIEATNRLPVKEQEEST